jgi:hypothetical protein
MPRMRFEHTTPVFERAKIVHALDRAATMIGTYQTVLCHNQEDHDMTLQRHDNLDSHRALRKKVI